MSLLIGKGRVKMNKQYTKEVEQAKANLADFIDRKEEATGCTWDEFRQTIFTPEEIVASDLRVAVMLELTNARMEKGISQKKLEELSGVRQPIIARMEKGHTSPQLDTVLKILAPLGKTLAVVPLNNEVATD